MKGRSNKACIALIGIGLLFVYIAQPLQAKRITGKVSSLGKGYIRLDIGSGQGVQVGDAGKVYYTVLVGKEKKPLKISVAEFRITRVFQKSSQATIEKRHGGVQVGYQAEVTGRRTKQQKTSPKKAKSVVKKGLQPGQTWRDSFLKMTFIWVPGGCFEMGCGNWTDTCSEGEGPVHQVCVNGFWLGRYEVTQGQWKRMMGYNPSEFSGCGDSCPVEMVYWEEAKEFARRLSEKTGYTFRLPTEAEWEYACRSGGTGVKYAGSDNPYDVAWYKDNASKRTHPVGQKKPNDLGLYDMSGNVWEWCLDVYDNDAYSKGTPPLNNPVYVGRRYTDLYNSGYQGVLGMLRDASGYRIVRGGSWGNISYRLRCSARIKGNPDKKRDWLGFRLVREIRRKK